MAELFNTLNEFKGFVSGHINQTVELASLEADIHTAGQRHIVPLLGAADYTALVTAHANSNLNPSQTGLLPYVRRALAHLAQYEYSATASVQMGESGLFRTESDTHKSAYRYQEKAYREKALADGYQALEEMLRFLSNNQGNYSTWAASEEGQAHLNGLLNYAADFRRVGVAEVDRYTYECLRPIINTVQEFAVQALLPATFWAGYMTRYKAGQLTTQEKELLRRQRLAIANWTLQEAIALHQVQQVGNRVVVVEEFGEQSQVNRTAPVLTNAMLSSMAHRAVTAVYTNSWITYIRSNAGSFPTIYDVASGGSNGSSDAWHIDTPEEIAAKMENEDTRMRQPVVRF